MSARDTEFTNLKYINIIIFMRNIYLVDGRVIIIAEYNKSQAVAKQKKIITRFLLIIIAILYITFVADVLFFYRFFKVSEGGF